MPAIKFTVYGNAQPAGSKRSMPIYKGKGPNREVRRRDNGSLMIATIDANPKSKDWKHAVSSAARQAYSGELLRGPLEVHFTFYRPRPKGHFGSGKNAAVLKPSADPYPTSKPDVLKLARGAEDAITGVCWADDAQIVDELISKRYGEPARVEIEITPL